MEEVGINMLNYIEGDYLNQGQSHSKVCRELLGI